MNSINLFNAVSVSFSMPWLLLLIIPAVGLMLWPYLRLKKQYRRTVSRITSLVLHSIIILLCGFMVSGMRFDYSHVSIKNDVIVLVDASDSSAPVKARMDEFVRQIADSCEDGYRLGVVTFAKDSVYAAELDTNAKRAYEKYLSGDKSPDGSATDIASALFYAQGLLDNPKSGRVIVLSDGRQTDGNALAAVKSLADDGTRVDSVFFSAASSGAEVQINDVSVPRSVALGDTVQITVTVESAAQTNAVLHLYDRDEPYAELDVQLSGGEQAFMFEYTLLTPGLHELRVEAVPEADGVTQNNVYYSYICVDSSKRILIVGDGEILRSIFEESYDVTTVSAGGVPTSVQELCRYDEVILSNVANADLPAGFVTALTEYVEIYGGGLYTAGGDRAYKQEDMENTALQELLPVQATTDAKSLGLLLVIDTSSSMKEIPAGSRDTRLELAKDAAIESVNALADDDYIGILTFDENPEVIVPMTQITDKSSIIRAIRDIELGWGTVYSKALEAAHGIMTSKSLDTELKHIIFLTDGNPVDGIEGHSGNMAQIMEYTNRIARAGITISTIALGQDASSDLIKEMADVGNGRYYDVVQESKLASIMREETTVAMGKYENKGDFTPSIVSHTPALSGITLLPTLGGYYGSRIKSGATLVLATEGNPIYAEWTRGAGKVGSFMCDLNGAWSNKFLADEVGIKFVFNSVSSRFPAETVDAYAEMRADFIRDNNTTELRLYSETKPTAYVVSPDGKRQALQITSVTDDVYASIFETQGVGVYTVEIYKAGESAPSLTAYTAVSYSDEYRMFADETECFTFMDTLSINGGGQVLFDTENMFGKKNEVVNGSFDPRLTFLIIAVVLFLTDIVIRKFKIDRLIEIIREKRAAKAKSE